MLHANRLSSGRGSGEVGAGHSARSSLRSDVDLSRDGGRSRFPPTRLRRLLRHGRARGRGGDQDVLALALTLRVVAQTQLLRVREHD